jgi:hypothetical protein
MDRTSFEKGFAIALTVVVIFCFVFGLSVGLIFWWIWG